MTAEMKTYRMKMRVVRGAPHFDTIDAETVDVQATNAWDADRAACARTMRAYPDAREAYVVSKRRVQQS